MSIWEFIMLLLKTLVFMPVIVIFLPVIVVAALIGLTVADDEEY